MSKRTGPFPAASNAKRMRQSTISFGTSEVSNSVEPAGPQADYTWSQSPGLMCFETNNWRENLPPMTAPEDCGKLKVAAFDLDHTLIKPKSPGKFPRYPTDYQFLNPKVLPKLREYSQAGCLLVIFSNQAGVSSGRPPPTFIKTRIQAVAQDISLPLGVFLATAKDSHRKPCLGMWLEFLSRIGGKRMIDFQNSFFVGDAAGRKGDFSNSDLKFSINTDLKFWTPETIFEGKPLDPKNLSLKGFDPRELVTLGEYVHEGQGDAPSKSDHLRRVLSSSEICDALIAGWCGDGRNDKPKQQCLLILSGPPAAGKTTFSKRFFEEEGYVRVNADELRTMTRCMDVAKASLNAGKSVVVDNTCSNKASRARFVKVASEAHKKVPVYCLKMETSKELALHLNVLREASSSGDIPRLPPVAFNFFFSRAVDPTVSEGFALVGSVKFVPWFASDSEKFAFTRLS